MGWSQVLSRQREEPNSTRQSRSSRTSSDVYLIIDNKACVHNVMALIDGRLIPHGKHADLHRRAINAYEHGPHRTLR
eukprot:1112552-Heterocapsa_arctica.AAC.1